MGRFRLAFLIPIALLSAVCGAVAADSLLIDDFENVAPWQLVHTALPVDFQAEANAHEGKSALALTVKGGRGFVQRKAAALPAWNAYDGISFWIKGDGSDEWGCIGFKGEFGWSAVFPLKDKEWHEVRLAWSEFTGPLEINSSPSSKPDSFESISLGRLTHNLHPDDKPFTIAKTLSFSIDDLRLINGVSSSRPRIEIGKFIPFSDVEKKLKNNEPVKILSLGDSTSIGKYPVRVGKWLGDYYKNDKITVYKRAMGGGTTSINRAWLKSDIEGLKVDLVMIMIGHNQVPRDPDQLKPDAAKNYVADLVKYLEEVAGITGSAPCGLIMTPNPSGGTDRSWPVFDSFADGLRKLTEDNKNLILADLYKHFKQFPREEYQAKLVPDGVHPNGQGELHIARVVFKAITGAEAPE